MPVIDAAIITVRLGEIGGFNVVLTLELSDATRVAGERPLERIVGRQN